MDDDNIAPPPRLLLPHWPDEYRQWDQFLSRAFHPQAYNEVRKFLIFIVEEQMTAGEEFVNDLFPREAVSTRDELRKQLVFRRFDPLSAKSRNYPFTGGFRKSFVDANLAHWETVEQRLGIPADVVLSCSAHTWTSHWLLTARDAFFDIDAGDARVSTFEVSYPDFLATSDSPEHVYHGTTVSKARRINRRKAGFIHDAARESGDYVHMNGALYFSSSRRFALAWAVYKLVSSSFFTRRWSLGISHTDTQPFGAWFNATSEPVTLQVSIITIDRPYSPQPGLDQTELPDSPDVQLVGPDCATSL